MRAWDLGPEGPAAAAPALRLRHAAAAGRVPVDRGVLCLLAVGREVWACVGGEVVVWGRD